MYVNIADEALLCVKLVHRLIVCSPFPFLGFMFQSFRIPREGELFFAPVVLFSLLNKHSLRTSRDLRDPDNEAASRWVVGRMWEEPFGEGGFPGISLIAWR